MQAVWEGESGEQLLIFLCLLAANEQQHRMQHERRGGLQFCFPDNKIRANRVSAWASFFHPQKLSWNGGIKLCFSVEQEAAALFFFWLPDRDISIVGGFFRHWHLHTPRFPANFQKREMINGSNFCPNSTFLPRMKVDFQCQEQRRK